MSPQYFRYIGIDYSGAATPTSRLTGLRIFQAIRDFEPEQVETTAGNGTSAKVGRWNWTRKEVAYWLLKQLSKPEPAIVGIDHAFSFPDSYFRRYNLKTWDEFLEDFHKYWPTDDDNEYIDFIRETHPPRIGRSNEFRLSEKRPEAKGTQSVFKFVGQGSVGKSTHAGIPWLRFLRRHPDLKDKVHFWPFDGFEVPEGKSVISEVWPTIFLSRYPVTGLNEHERDAYCVAKWLQDADRDNTLHKYYVSALTARERDIVRREGWILGIV